ncbi:MAG TPA: prepilin-type N-terminal cleavage/methylation domain-containing protein, partial [bacterium]|nr:prepilin-type N-terminal cleavage/methylation domain-containing protein [bacterium]
MKFKAFTLIELMIVLAIIVIIATASVPQVQVWIARNRGNKAVAQIISDFLKAKSVANYTVNDTNVTIGAENVQIGVRPEIAMMFRKNRYFILQRNDTSAAWSENDDLKTIELERNVFIEFVNGSPTNLAGDTPTLVFTSTGKLKQTSDNKIVNPAAVPDFSCGSSLNSPLDGKKVFYAVLRTVVNEHDPD